MSDVPDEYDDWSVDELEVEIEEIDDPEVIQSYLAYESENKDRVTAVDALEERLDEITAETQPSDEEESDGPEIDDIPEGTTRIRVRNHKKVGQHIAGYSFKAGESKLIPDRPDVRDALRSGDLQYVGPR